MNLRPFRFGVLGESVHSATELVDTARRAETEGYATFLIRDHFIDEPFGHQLAPVAALATVAAVTETLRVGSLVICNDYRHPVLLAKEVAYRSAVGLRTREVVTALRPEAWDEILGIADTAPANAAGAFARGWVDDVGYRAWQGHSRAAQLASSAIAHNAMHLGEAITVRSQAGFGLGI